MLPAEMKGVKYGAGCFETFRSYDGRFLHLEEHIERFNRGLDYLGVLPPKGLNENRVRFLLTELLKINGLSEANARIRMQGSIGRGGGYAVSPQTSFHLMVTADPLKPQPDQYRLSTVPVRSVPSQCRPADLKLSNTLHYMKAWQKAREQQAEDALMLTVDGYIAETAIANLFWKSGQVVYTPSEQCDLLPGILRKAVSTVLTSESGKLADRLETGKFKPDALKQADLVWVTNSVKEIQPVIAVDDNKYPGKDSFYKALDSAFENYKQENLT